MSEILASTVDRLRKDLTGGASQTAREIAGCLANICEEAGTSSDAVVRSFDYASREILKAQPFMAPIKHVVNLGYLEIDRLLADRNRGASLGREVSAVLREFASTSLGAIEQIAKFGARRLAGRKRVFVFSLSGTVMAVIKRAAKECGGFEVVITEAKPGSEGIEAARLIGEMGLEVSLTSDAAMLLAVEQCDYAITGADCITSTGYVINKVGTAVAALCCAHHKVPFAVATETYKFDPATALGLPQVIVEGRSEQIVPSKVHDRVSIANPQVDLTPCELVGEFITETGIWGGQGHTLLAAARKVSPRFVALMESLAGDPGYLGATREAI